MISLIRSMKEYRILIILSICIFAEMVRRGETVDWDEETSV